MSRKGVGRGGERKDARFRRELERKGTISGAATKKGGIVPLEFINVGV